MDDIPREDLDVTINVHDNTFEVYKAILIRSLAVFKGMLEHNIEESNSSNLEIAEMAPVFFKALIDYLYCKLN